jgi:putative ubiquitin-RnfH superfamily antitoxin RatB of RatAB toxin-antitoxin module
MDITVVLALPNKQVSVSLEVREGCTAREALQLSLAKGINLADAGLHVETVPLGVFGERVPDNEMLNQGDRLEIYRPLAQDPMELRRQRAAETKKK